MDNQVNNSSRATFVLVVILILLGALAVLWYSGHLPGVSGPTGSPSDNAAAKSRQGVIDSVANIEVDTGNPASRAAVVSSVKKIKVDDSAKAQASREAVLKSLQQVK